MIKKMLNNENGLGHILILILVVVVIAGVGFVGYKVANNKSTPPVSTGSSQKSGSNSSSGQSSTSTLATDASCLASYHDANLCHFASNSANFDKTAYVATITETSPQGVASNMTLSSDGKGNTSLVAMSGGQQLSTVSLSGNTYIQTGTGTTWLEYPAGTAGNPSESSNPTSAMNIGVGSNGITFKAEGTASCGSLTCYKYEILDSAQPGTTQSALFDTKSYKLREWQESDSTSGTTTMDITYQAVNIVAPSPVKPYGQAI
jgi:hypothetical protein